MKELFNQIIKEMTAGRNTILAMIVADEGSAPRGSGSWMLVGENGRLQGTIGGGAVEYNSEKMALDLMQTKQSMIHEFKLHTNDQEDIGMVCGGEVSVMFCYIDATDSIWKESAVAVLRRLNKREEGWLLFDLRNMTGVPALLADDRLMSGEADLSQLQGNLAGINPLLIGDYYAVPLPREGRVLIFGGGHISQELVPVLAHLDFRPIVFENRAEYARPELFHGAEQVILGDYDAISDQLTINKEDYVVVMTNGHAHDFTVQYQVMCGPYYYLGVIGSRAKTESLNHRLMMRGITPEQLEQVHTPIGVSIKAVTPAEIAISIAGELIMMRTERRKAVGMEAVHCPV